MKTPIRNPFPRSIRGRLSLMFTLVFGAALITTSYVCFKVFTRTHLEDFDAFLFNLAVEIAALVPKDGKPAPRVIPQPPQELEKHRLFSIRRTYSQLSDESGVILSRSRSLGETKALPYERADYQAALATGAAYRTVSRIDFSEGEDAGKPYRLITYIIPHSGGAPWILEIAAPLTLLQRGNSEFLWLLLVLIPFSAVVSGILGYGASRRAFSPVVHMMEKTAQIEMKSLKERIEVRESDAELHELGRTLNQLLEKVENAVSSQERFIADASHQLKTPLAIVRGELELLQARAGHPPEVAEALRNTSQEVGQLIGLVENLLLLARMDAGLDTIRLEPIRLDELLSEATARLQYVAKRRGIRLTSELRPYSQQPERNIDFEFLGDADLFRCLLENLIENAIKYSGENGHVSVRLAEDDRSFLLEVTDRGQGMTPEEVATIFERFWRDPHKSVTVPGAGLGLAIAKKIAELHRGTIGVVSERGVGSTFRVELRKS